MSTLATNVIGKSYNLPVSWDGRRYSDQDAVPAFTAPSSLAASESSGTITLTWTNGTATAETIVERSLTGDGGWSTIATKAATVATHDDAPGGSGTFYYRVSHLQNEQQTSYSSTVSETISYVPPVADGDEKTVTITGAGSNVPAGNQSFLGGTGGVVESGTNGALFETGMPANWEQPGGDGPEFSNARTLNGTQSLLNDRTGSAYQFGIRYDHGSSQRVQFVRVSYYMENPNGTYGQLKFVRFVGAINTYGGLHDLNQPNHYITFFSPLAVPPGSRTYMPVNNSTLGGSNVNRQEDAGSSGETNGYYAENEWVTLEIYSVHNSDVSTADGTVRLVARSEASGNIIADYTWSNVRLDYDGADRGRWLVIQFYMGNGLDYSCKVYIDRDVYVSSNTSSATPPKYILLGDASTYSACTKFTVCEYTAWVDNGATSDITFRVNQGYHASLSGIYVYAMSGPNTPINTTGVALS